MSGWMPYLIAVLAVLGSFLPLWAAAHAVDTPPPLMLAKKYLGQEVLSEFSVSEKYDGVRAYWDGMQLMTRSGHIIPVPDWFVAELPDVALDGELWLDYGRFDEVSGLIRSSDSDTDALWQEVKFMVFDMPSEPGPFRHRYSVLRNMMNSLAGTECQLVLQRDIQSHGELDKLLNETVAAGGEGLMLHRWDSFYQSGRSGDLLKVTETDDDEAIVLGYVPGQGRLQGMMGALRVRLSDGREFRLGTGFSDQERQEPPPVGTTVRFTYRGHTASGLPRFASFDRIRPEE